MENVYICDIDGTLANNSHRSPFNESKVSDDSPLPTCQIISELTEKVIFFSGRTEACRKDTEAWLDKFVGITTNRELYMRQIKDGRGDDIVKLEMYNNYIKDKYNVLAVFDDRLRVCRMWYSLGIFVFNCNQGLVEF